MMLNINYSIALRLEHVYEAV